MGILERTRHVVRADLNDLIRKAKNPEAVLEAYLDELQTVQTEAESLRSAEAAEREMYAARIRDVRDAGQMLEKKAKACLRLDDEELARTALERKMQVERELVDLQRELDHRQTSLDVLDDSMDALGLRISEVSRKRREVRYRRQVLEARSELQKAMGRLETHGDEPIMDEAEDGLAAAESRLEAFESLEDEDLDQRARKMEAVHRRRERDQQIDEQLSALKAEIDEE